jgi:hypothetical protein
LVAGGWFVVREKYCWLVANKPSEQGGKWYTHKRLKKYPISCSQPFLPSKIPVALFRSQNLSKI